MMHAISTLALPSPSLDLSSLHGSMPRTQQHHDLFVQMLHIPPHAFEVLHELIKDHPVFQNNSDYQLAVTLYRMGHFGNAAVLQAKHEA